MWRWIVARFDTREGLVDQVGQRVWPVVTGYIVGQTAIAAIDATMIALGALVLGVPERRRDPGDHVLRRLHPLHRRARSPGSSP